MSMKNLKEFAWQLRNIIDFLGSNLKLISEEIY
jgi:hypothetical protein